MLLKRKKRGGGKEFTRQIIEAEKQMSNLLMKNCFISQVLRNKN